MVFATKEDEFLKSYKYTQEGYASLLTIYTALHMALCIAMYAYI